MTITEERPTETPAKGATGKYASAARKAIGGNVLVFTGPVRGETWITESHWASPYGHGGLASGLFADDPGHAVWITAPNDKGEQVVPNEGTPPNLEMVISDELVTLEGQIDLVPVKVDGVGEIFTRDGAKVFTTGKDDCLALNPDYLDILAPKRDDCGTYDRDQYAVRYTQPQTAYGKTKPVAVWRELKSVSLKDGKQSHWILCGVVMPVRVG